MNIENQTQYILLGAVLTFSEYADVLQDLKIDDFCPELRDTFAAIRGYWEHNDRWNPVEVMGRYDNCKKLWVNAWMPLVQSSSATSPMT